MPNVAEEIRTPQSTSVDEEGLNNLPYLAGLLHDLGKLDPAFQRRLQHSDDLLASSGLWSVVRENSAEKLNVLAQEGAINIEDAMTLAAVALSRAADSAFESVHEAKAMNQDIVSRSRKISSAQEASRALIEGLVHG
jgi:hypothetical protein